MATQSDLQEMHDAITDTMTVVRKRKAELTEELRQYGLDTPEAIEACAKAYQASQPLSPGGLQRSGSRMERALQHI